MTQTSRLGLPLIEAGQAQKHVTHNEALAALDGLVQAAVLDRHLAAPPASPADGQAWIVAPSPTGAWAGKSGEIALRLAGGWTFLSPAAGWRAWVADEARLFVFDGTAWVDLVATAATALQNLALLGIGTTADAANPLAAKINKALFTALGAGEGGDGDLRFTLNKESAGDVLSLLFQSGFSGRAELGLVGDDDLALKVSADGSAWTEALRVDRTNGEMRHATCRPFADNVSTLGTAAFRWSQIYAATATISTSDRREKLDVEDVGVGLDFLRRLRPVTYRLRVAGHDPAPDGSLMPREGRRRHAGLVAQDVRAALGSADLALWTRDAATGREGLRYEELIPVVVKAVQELDAAHRALAARMGPTPPDGTPAPASEP